MTRRDTLICCLAILGIGILAWVNQDVAARLDQIEQDQAEIRAGIERLEEGTERLLQWDRPLLPEVGMEVQAAPEREYLGEFTIFAYCPCRYCCGKADGVTVSGTTATEGRTVAADWDILPAGTVIHIDGLGDRVVEDKGAGIKGATLDLYMDSHEAALEFGVQKVQVWIYE